MEGYIELAAIPVGDKAHQMPLPASWRRAHKDMELVPIVSKDVEVDPSGRYDNIAYLSAFGDSMSFVGGINKPKLVSSFLQTPCLASGVEPADLHGSVLFCANCVCIEMKLSKFALNMIYPSRHDHQ